MGHTDYYYVEILSVKFTEFDLISFDFGEALCFVPVSEELKWNRQYKESTDFVRALNYSSKRGARVRSLLFLCKNPKIRGKEPRTRGTENSRREMKRHEEGFTLHTVVISFGGRVVSLDNSTSTLSIESPRILLHPGKASRGFRKEKNSWKESPIRLSLYDEIVVVGQLRLELEL